MKNLEIYLSPHKVHLEVTHAVHYFENIMQIIMFYNYEAVVLHIFYKL